MSGTSIFENFRQDKVDSTVQGFIDELIERDNSRIDSIEPYNNFDKLTSIEAALIDWAKSRDKPSAELKSLCKIREKFNGTLQVYFLVTDTVMSKLAAIINSGLINEHIKPPGLEVCFDSDKDVIRNLQVVNAEKLEVEGLSSLIQRIDEICDKNYENVLFNITGGYKALIPYLTVIAQTFKMPTFYIYEESEDLIKIPQLPFEFDFSLIEENYLAFESIKPIKSAGKSDQDSGEIAKTRSLPDFKNAISSEEKEAKSEMELLENAGLIYVKENKVGLTPIGNLLYKRHEMLYLNKVFERQKILGGLVELKLSKYFYEILYGYKAKVRSSVKKRIKINGEVHVCEIDSTVEHSEGIIFVEVKMISDTLKRADDVLGNILNKISNEAFKELWNENKHQNKELRVYLVSHKSLPEIFIEKLSKFNKDNKDLVKKLKMSWHLIKLKTGYKRDANWDILESNLSEIFKEEA